MELFNFDAVFSFTKKWLIENFCEESPIDKVEDGAEGIRDLGGRNLKKRHAELVSASLESKCKIFTEPYSNFSLTKGKE